MSEQVKTKIYRLVNSIEDEAVLQMVAADIAYYTGSTDIWDDLDESQKEQLNEAIAEADNGETIDWNTFKNEMNEWKKK